MGVEACHAAMGLDPPAPSTILPPSEGNFVSCGTPEMIFAPEADDSFGGVLVYF